MSTNNNTSNFNNVGGSCGPSSLQLKATKSIDIGTPSDFHHCLSVQQELLGDQSSSSMQFQSSLTANNSASSPTDEAAGSESAGSSTNNSSSRGNTSNGHLKSANSGNGSPIMRIRVMGKSSLSLLFEKFHGTDNSQKLIDY
jgi:hypothetical protein